MVIEATCAPVSLPTHITLVRPHNFVFVLIPVVPHQTCGRLLYMTFEILQMVVSLSTNITFVGLDGLVHCFRSLCLARAMSHDKKGLYRVPRRYLSGVTMLTVFSWGYVFQ